MLPVLVRAREWTNAGIDVSLVDETGVLFYSGMTPEYLGGVYEEEEVGIPLDVLCRGNGVRLIRARAVALDVDERVIRLEDGSAETFDVAAFDIGSVTPRAPSLVVPTKPLDSLIALRHRTEQVLDDMSQVLRLVIAGGGAAGVEIALNIRGLFAARGRLAALKLCIVESDDRLLPRFPSGMGAYASRLLSDCDIRFDSRVEHVTETTARLSDGSTVEAGIVLWATGSTGRPIFSDVGLSCDENGFVRVAQTLQHDLYPEIFAAGDCAAVNGHEHLRRIGVHAVRQGSVLAANLAAAVGALQRREALDALDLGRFRPYPVAPLILSTGRPEAMWSAGKFWLHGRALLRLKHFIDRRWIRQYQDDGRNG